MMCRGNNRNNRNSRPAKEPVRALCAGNGVLMDVLGGKELGEGKSVGDSDWG
jgi:hypothetical protein